MVSRCLQAAREFSRSRRPHEDGLLALRCLDRDARLFKRRRDEPAPAVPASNSTPTPIEVALPARITYPILNPSLLPDVAARRDATESEVRALPGVRLTT
jgi:importin subunit alpha-6/7